eukprot:m.167891 g.167891  ORF g.167891 m.167891 type:complete len:234 (-) comp9904_c1_seq38:525-1226(-)
MRNLLLSASCTVVLLGTDSMVANMVTKFAASRFDDQVPWAYFMTALPTIKLDVLFDQLAVQSKVKRVDVMRFLPPALEAFLNRHLRAGRGLTAEVLYTVLRREEFQNSRVSEIPIPELLFQIREMFQASMASRKPFAFSEDTLEARVAMYLPLYTKENAQRCADLARRGLPVEGIEDTHLVPARDLPRQCLWVSSHFARLAVASEVVFERADRASKLEMKIEGTLDKFTAWAA